jgi:TPP-dependent pyruvate/acetoin dehydrogenase alpha subunit
MPGHEVDGNDVLACYEAASGLVRRARSGGGPALLVVKTYRMLGHSSSDDPTRYRDKAEVEVWERRDPIRRFARFLERRGALQPGETAHIETELFREIDRVIHAEEEAAPMSWRSLVEDVYAEVPRSLRAQYNEFVRVAERYGEARPGDGAFPL